MMKKLVLTLTLTLIATLIAVPASAQKDKKAFDDPFADDEPAPKVVKDKPTGDKPTTPPKADKPKADKPATTPVPPPPVVDPAAQAKAIQDAVSAALKAQAEANKKAMEEWKKGVEETLNKRLGEQEKLDKLRWDSEYLTTSNFFGRLWWLWVFILGPYLIICGLITRAAWKRAAQAETTVTAVNAKLAAVAASKATTT